MASDTKAQLRRFVGCRVFWTAIGCIIAYFVLGLALPEQPFLELIRILQATTAIVVVIAFSADAWESITSKDTDRTDSIVLGIFLQHVSLFWIGFWLLLYRLSGRPEWMLNTLFFGFWGGWLSSLAALLHVWAPGVLRRVDNDAEVPTARLRAVGVAAALGVFGVLVVLATQPNARWLVESLRPWVR
jgi:hypothetical protein